MPRKSRGSDGLRYVWCEMSPASRAMSFVAPVTASWMPRIDAASALSLARTTTVTLICRSSPTLHGPGHAQYLLARRLHVVGFAGMLLRLRHELVLLVGPNRPTAVALDLFGHWSPSLAGASDDRLIYSLACWRKIGVDAEDLPGRQNVHRVRRDAARRAPASAAPGSPGAGCAGGRARSRN